MYSMNRNGKSYEFNVLAGAATISSGLFLLLRRSTREGFLPNAWGIPAGQVNHNEDPADACLRELREETGLEGEIIELVGYSTFASKQGAHQLSNLQLNFLVNVTGLDVTLDSNSHSSFQWIPVDDADNELLDPFTRQIMASARTYLKEADSPKIGQRLGLGRGGQT
jgi:ADP-ribose pyrophosphatase YjhB (NUDIX family)